VIFVAKKSSAASSLTQEAKEFGPLKSVKVKSSFEHWSDYHLEDGTVISLRPVFLDAGRSKQFNKEGEPIYVVRHGVFLKTKVPHKLKKQM
jgi:hypothetical protein